MAVYSSAILRRSLATIKLNIFRITDNQVRHPGPIFKSLLNTNLSSPINYCTKPFEVNTKVVKDVILYNYENPKFFRMLNLFAIAQFMFWNYLSHTAYTTLIDAPVKEDTDAPWYERINLGENKYRNGLTLLSLFLGYGILAVAWLYSLRSVRYVILRKGGNEISVVTYGPFNKNSIITVPMQCVSAKESRQTARVQLPLKIKNKSFYYILDMRGQFKNAQLFDYTAGLQRNLNK